MCTVVTSWSEGEPVHILAVRDELVSRAFDDPGEWWPDLPGVVGGRDRLAGGSWCVTDVATGVTALVLNRRERHTGTPSRGVLPLAAVRSGADWTREVDHRAMASFDLVLAGPHGVAVWVWDANALARVDLSPGTHMVTSGGGVDGEDDKTRRFAPQFAATDPDSWRDIVTAREPQDDAAALIVRHPFETDTYASVLAQTMRVEPGRLHVAYSRTPSDAGCWTEHTW